MVTFILPIALSVIRFYLYNPSKKYDGQLLDTVKQSVIYLSLGDTTSMTGKHVSDVLNVVQYSDIKGGM